MNVALRVLLVVISAGLGIFSFPIVGWAGLAVVAWIPLLLALGGAKASHASYLGIFHGAIFYGVTMSWLLDVFRGSWQTYIPLILIMSLFTGFFARGYAVACRRYGSGWATALFASVWWTAMEFYRSEIFYLKFPWMTPGVGLGPTWVSPVLGVYGVSFLIVLGAALLSQKKKHRVIGAALLVVMLASIWIQKNRAVPQDTSVRVVAVQSEVADIDNYIKLTRTVTAQEDVDLVLWPEYALPSDVRRNKIQWKQLTELSAETGAVVVVGTQTLITDPVKGWRNTALTLDKNGALGEHYKNHTVHFFDDGVAGTEAKAVTTPQWKIGTSICFDNDYQDVVRRMVADGAEFLAIPSMDAIHWGEKQHYQHAELFRHRAAENGRWIVVAATSGVTQVIDPNGNCIKSLPIIEEGVLTAEIGKSSQQTIYTRFGWLFPWITMCVGGIWVLWLFMQGVREKRQSRDTRTA